MTGQDMLFSITHEAGCRKHSSRTTAKVVKGLRVVPYAPKQLCFSGRPGVKHCSPEKTDTLLPTSKWTLALQRSGWKYWYTHSPLIPEIFFVLFRRCLKFDRNPAKGERQKTSRNRGAGLSEGGRVCHGTQGLGLTRPALAFEALGLLSLKE